MPFQFICSKCGSTLLVAGEEILRYQTTSNASKHNQNISTIEAFIKRKIGGTCPFCGHKLAARPLTIDVCPIAKKRVAKAGSVYGL